VRIAELEKFRNLILVNVKIVEQIAMQKMALAGAKKN